MTGLGVISLIASKLMHDLYVPELDCLVSVQARRLASNQIIRTLPVANMLLQQSSLQHLCLMAARTAGAVVLLVHRQQSPTQSFHNTSLAAVLLFRLSWVALLTPSCSISSMAAATALLQVD